MIKALVFDFFGVLYPDTYNEFVAKRAVELSSEDQEQLYELHARSNRGHISIEEAIGQMARLVSLPAIEIRYELYGKDQVNTDLVAYIATLKPRYKIGLLSNVGKGFLHDFFTQHDLHQYFDAVTLSCLVGYIKPEPESYRLAAGALDVSPAECLMIDDKQRNIDGGEAAGMLGLLYENFPQFEKDLTSYLDQNE
jgi:HAD superfamily hydrolase (TIGR01509 family)